MNELLIQAVNLSISASYFVLAVLLLRPLLKKAPRWISVALWGLVGLRLALPFSVESMLSLLPSAQTIPTDLAAPPSVGIQSGLPVVEGSFPADISQTLSPIVTPGTTPAAGADPLQTWLFVAAIVWMVGVLGMLGYTTFSYLRLRRQVLDAVRVDGNIYRSEHIASPFVLGFFRPRIYLPTGLAEADAPHVIAHERSHIARRDHWIKPLGFALLSLYWFNPVLWVAYILLCRDIEIACDERVIRTLGTGLRIDYSQALLSCSISRKSIAACPLAFGEVSVKHRIKSILHYKHPGFWITLVALVLCAALAVSFLTDPVENDLEVPSPAETQPATEPAPTQPQAPIMAPEPPARADYTPLPGRSPTAEVDKYYIPTAGAWWEDATEDCTLEEAEALFGQPGVRLNGARQGYYWLVDGYSVLLYFSGPEETCGARCYYYGQMPENIEAIRQDFLSIDLADVETVTLTGLNSLGSSVTVTVPETLAQEAITCFQAAAQDATAVGLEGPDYMSRCRRYLTIYTADGQQTTVDFTQLLRIGTYWFAPTAQQQEAIYHDLYPQLVTLLAEPLRQQLLQLQAEDVQVQLLARSYEGTGESLDQAAVLGCLQKILGEFDHYGDQYYYADGKQALEIQLQLYDWPMSVYVLSGGYVVIDGFAYRINTYDSWWKELLSLYRAQL